MKALRASIFAAVAVVGGLIIGYDDTVTRTYATRADAEADRLFARGWLPDVLPTSSTGILTRNDLDRNTSTGEFYFDSADRAEFLERLRRLPVRDGQGHLGYGYEEWVFLLDRREGFCRYELDLSQ